LAEESSSIIASNGTSINGVGINGVGINGVGINGTSINGVGINGVGINGTSLVGTGLNGQTLQGDDFVGAALTAYLADGTTVALHIDAAAPSPSDPEIWYYTVTYQGTGGAWTGLCGLDAQGQPIPVIAHAGRWDASVETPTGGSWIDDPALFTFACQRSTVAKCTELGYKPWKTIQECDGANCQTRSLRAWHQACTRMIRADYCGNGKSLTHNGVPINVWDDFSIQTQAQVPSDWTNDAEWGPDGAVCIRDYRLNNTGDSASYVAQHCVHNKNGKFGCFGGKSTFFTSNGFSTPLEERSLIRNQSDPTP
jgi:hypothetical protein